MSNLATYGHAVEYVKRITEFIDGEPTGSLSVCRTCASFSRADFFHESHYCGRNPDVQFVTHEYASCNKFNRREYKDCIK